MAEDRYGIFDFLKGLSPVERRLFEQRQSMTATLPKGQQRGASLASLLGLGHRVQAPPGNTSFGGYGGLLEYFT